MKEGRVKNDAHHCEKGGSVFRSNREGAMKDLLAKSPRGGIEERLGLRLEWS